MATDWSLTIDCTDPTRVSAFWEVALRYIKRPLPEGHASWAEYYAAIGYELDEDDEFYEGAYLCDPEGRRPNLFFQLVPEKHTGKNWLHLDLKVSGGRDRPAAERGPLIEAEVARLVAAGGAGAAAGGVGRGAGLRGDAGSGGQPVLRRVSWGFDRVGERSTVKVQVAAGLRTTVASGPGRARVGVGLRGSRLSGAVSLSPVRAHRSTAPC